jgi:hypothetical protein
MHVGGGKSDHDISHNSPYLESMCRSLEGTVDWQQQRCRSSTCVCARWYRCMWKVADDNTAGSSFASSRRLSKSACCCGVHACCVLAAW